MSPYYIDSDREFPPTLTYQEAEMIRLTIGHYDS